MKNPFERVPVPSTEKEVEAKQESLTFDKGDRVRIKHPEAVSSDPKLDAFDSERDYEVDEVRQDGNSQLLHMKGFPKNEGWLEGLWWDKVEEDKE